MLPIFAITGRSVWFVFANAFTLFRLTWLPISALIAAGYGIAYGVVRVVPERDLEAIMVTDIFMAAMYTELLLQGLALSVIAVAVHKIILFGDRRPGVYFAFPFGSTELRYVLMGALSITAVLLLGFLIASGPTLIYYQESVKTGASQPSGAMSALLLATALVAYVALVWLSLRLMVWPPTVVANNRLSFGEAWAASRGNVLALLAVYFASTITFIVIGAAVLMVAARVQGGVDLLGMKGFLEFFVTLEDKIVRLIEGRVSAPFVAYEFAYQFFVTTYAVAVLSYTYKALKGLDADLPITAQPDFAADLPDGQKPLGAL